LSQLSREDLLSSAHKGLIQLATESWRLSRLFTRLLQRLEPTDQQRYAAQLRFFLNALEESVAMAQLKLINLEGQPYDPGMAATPLNSADFTGEDSVIVEQMLEPIIMLDGRVLKSGTVVLGKASI
jgi:hypothetical protein